MNRTFKFYSENSVLDWAEVSCGILIRTPGSFLFLQMVMSGDSHGGHLENLKIFRRDLFSRTSYRIELIFCGICSGYDDKT